MNEKLSKRYVVVMITDTKKYYLSTKYEQAVMNLMGCCYIWGCKKEARIFNTKKEAQATIKDMNRHGTGRDAIIEDIIY